MTEKENTFCQRSSLILDDLERGDIDAHEAEWKLMDLGWCSEAIANTLEGRGSLEKSAAKNADDDG
jgi:hypothetical protein